MPDPETQLRQQLLQVTIQNILLTQNQNALIGVIDGLKIQVKISTEKVENLCGMILKQYQVEGIVRAENGKMMNEMRTLRDSAVKHLREIRSQ